MDWHRYERSFHHRGCGSSLIGDRVGSATELMGDLDGALHAYEQALRHNFQSIQAMNAISCILRTKENFPRAVEYLQGILKLDQSNGEVWGSLGQYQSSAFVSRCSNGEATQDIAFS